MDFLRRGTNDQPQTVRGGMGQSPTVNVPGEPARPKQTSGDGVQISGWMRAVFMVLLISLAVLAVSITALMLFGKSSPEGTYVDTSKQQAVFLTNGQVYFGKIRELNAKFVSLEEIYYLNSQESADTEATPNLSLVKLGCELHGPQDRMVINREQVSFWENLKTDGKVAKAIDQWKSQNPDGQTCTDTTSSTQQSTGNPSDN